MIKPQEKNLNETEIRNLPDKELKVIVIKTFTELGRRTVRTSTKRWKIAWVDLETIVMLSEVSQTEKDKYYMISLICGI